MDLKASNHPSAKPADPEVRAVDAQLRGGAPLPELPPQLPRQRGLRLRGLRPAWDVQTPTRVRRLHRRGVRRLQRRQPHPRRHQVSLIMVV